MAHLGGEEAARSQNLKWPETFIYSPDGHNCISIILTISNFCQLDFLSANSQIQYVIINWVKLIHFVPNKLAIGATVNNPNF